MAAWHLLLRTLTLSVLSMERGTTLSMIHARRHTRPVSGRGALNYANAFLHVFDHHETSKGLLTEDGTVFVVDVKERECRLRYVVPRYEHDYDFVSLTVSMKEVVTWSRRSGVVVQAKMEDNNKNVLFDFLSTRQTE